MQRTRTGTLGIKVAAGITSLALLAGCGGASSASPANSGGSKDSLPTEIKIGFFSPLTGGSAAFGTGAQRGIQYAIDTLNAAGGIKGHKVALVGYDDKADPAEAVQAVTRLAQRDKVVAVIGGSTSTATLATAEVTRKFKLPQITPIAGAVDLTRKGNPYILRNVTNNDGMGRKMADYAVKELKLKSFAIFMQNDDYGRENAAAFEAEVKALGAAVVANESFQPKDQNFAGQLGKFAAAKPDAIFISGYYTEGALMAKQAREMGIQARMLGLNVLSAPQYRELGGSAVDGTYFVADYHPDAPNATEAMKAFVKEWQGKFNKAPDVYEVHGYDTMMILARAIEAAGSVDPDAIVKQVLALKDYPGVSGATTFQPNGDALKPVVIVAIEKGQLVPKTVY